MLEMNFAGGKKALVLAPPGQVEFLGNGQGGGVTSFEWTVPEGVYSVSIVAIGAGERPGFTGTARGGKGACLRYVNDIPVEPGDVLFGEVGNSQDLMSSTTSNWASSSGNSSWIKRRTNNETLVMAPGGNISTSFAVGTGGDGSAGLTSTNSAREGAAGAGAAGYVGSGSASSATPPSDPTAGTGGAVTISNPNSAYRYSTGQRGGGSYLTGDHPEGAALGAGGGITVATLTSNGSLFGRSASPGLRGGLRIMWGEGRRYPNNARNV